MGHQVSVGIVVQRFQGTALVYLATGPGALAGGPLEVCVAAASQRHRILLNVGLAYTLPGHLSVTFFDSIYGEFCRGSVIVDHQPVIQIQIHLIFIFIFADKRLRGGVLAIAKIHADNDGVLWIVIGQMKAF